MNGLAVNERVSPVGLCHNLEDQPQRRFYLNRLHFLLSVYSPQALRSRDGSLYWPEISGGMDHGDGDRMSKRNGYL